MKPTKWKKTNHTSITPLSEATFGMGVRVTVNIKCDNGHELHRVNAKLVRSIHAAGYFIHCPECRSEVRLLRSEFDIRPSVRPKAR